jgi:methyl-accepting chemotaxis protein
MAVSDTALTEVSRVLQAIAEGDLTQRVQGRFEGVFASMQADANASTQRLADIVAGIQNAAEQITTAAREISTGNQDLSRRTEGQAANLEETAASMEELTSTVKQNADSARTANQLASSAAEVASHGGQIIREVVSTMDGISGSSRKVGEIISVIDGIAFQTNILALNAAVEAARAGEQGRGFAVVASEVRSLAQRSAAAAKEIKDLITDSIERVDAGAGLVGRAGSTMEEIVTSVRRVNDIMSEISAASAEQSAGIEQVNQTITHLDEATQQNAALVEEATAAARSMEEQADALVESVGVFRIG